MAQSGAHLVDRVFPNVPVRQWVLSVPWQLRDLLAARAPVLSAVLQTFERVVLGWYRQRARELGISHPETGSVSVQQRFGGSMNAHCHVHSANVDGVFSLDARSGKAVFHFVRPPNHDDIRAVANQVARRVLKMLARRGLLAEPDYHNNEATDVDAALDGCRKTAMARGRFERIDDAGQSQPLLFDDDRRFNQRKSSPWAAECEGFSVHAGVAFCALDRKGRETLLRYLLRPAIALERVSILRDGSIAYRTKYGTRSGASHRVMSPNEFMCRMAALIPPPRIPMLRYHGVLAPASRWRPLVVPGSDNAPMGNECSSAPRGGEHPSSVPIACAPAAVSTQPAAQPPPRTTPAPMPGAISDGAQLCALLAPHAAIGTDLSAPARPARSSSYISWALLLARTFGIDALACSHCQGRLRPIAVITREEIVRKILSHLHLPLSPETLSDDYSLVYDVTGEPMPAWALGTDPQPEPDERGPPENWDCIDLSGADD